jgi:hypothetical protein
MLLQFLKRRRERRIKQKIIFYLLRHPTDLCYVISHAEHIYRYITGANQNKSAMLKNLNIHIIHVNESLPAMIWETNPRHAEDVTLTCTIDYPLAKPCRFPVKSNANLYGIILQICVQYHKIFEEERKKPGTYKIYGHSLSQIFMEGIEITDGNIKLQIGS